MLRLIVVGSHTCNSSRSFVTMPPKRRNQTQGSKTKTEESRTSSKRSRIDDASTKDTKSMEKAGRKSKSLNQEEEEFVHWLMKSEPDSRIEKGVDVKFGFEDLIKEPEQTACWDGVRNYQARNFLRDKIKTGHECFFYHSNTKVPGIVGVVKVVKDGYPDHTQFDKKDIHYDPKSTKADPRWYMVDVQYDRWLDRLIPLSELKELHLKHKQTGGPLAKLALFTQARLSVQPIRKEEWEYILALGKTPNGNNGSD